MVVHVMQWQIHPDKVQQYAEWQQGAIQRTMSVPGVVEFRGYRPVSGPSEVVVTYEFEDLEAWAAWRDSDTIKGVLQELYTLALNVTSELWGPSKFVPEPIRPGA